MLKERLIKFIIILLLLILFTQNIMAESLIISIPEKVIVGGEQIILGEIASIKGEINQEIVNLDLGKSPYPGYIKIISQNMLSLILQDAGYSRSDFKLDMEKRVEVERASKSISIKELNNFVSSYIEDAINIEKGELIITPTFNPGEILIPDREYRLEIPDNNYNLSNSVSLPVDIIIEDKLWKRIYLGFELKHYQEVLIAKRDIGQGESIKADDFYLGEKEIGIIRGELVKEIDNNLSNKVARVSIAKDQILSTYYLKEPLLIKRGDYVQVEVIVANVKIATMVIARQNGKKGDYILVENSDNGKKFNALVINSQLVRVIK